MSVLIKLNYKLPKELETNVKFKKCTVLNFQYRSKEKPNQSTKPINQTTRKKEQAREGYTPRAYPSRAPVLSFAPIYFLAPATRAKQQPSTL